MKVLFVNTSEEEHGLTEKGILECSKVLKENEIDTDILWAYPSIHACTSCGKCLKRRICIFDGVENDIAKKSASFDALVVGIDVIFNEPSKQAIDFMECLFRSCNEAYASKVGAVILSSKNKNTKKAYQRMNTYFSASCMPVVTGRYYNTIIEDDYMEEMKALGKNLSWILKCIYLGNQQGIKNDIFSNKLDEFMKGR